MKGSAKHIRPEHKDALDDVVRFLESANVNVRLAGNSTISSYYKEIYLGVWDKENSETGTSPIVVTDMIFKRLRTANVDAPLRPLASWSYCRYRFDYKGATFDIAHYAYEEKLDCSGH